MPNFKLLHETKNEETKQGLAFQQHDNEKDDSNDENCEVWAQGKESPPFVTFQLDWTQLKDPSYASFDNYEAHWNVHTTNQQATHQDSSVEFCLNS